MASATAPFRKATKERAKVPDMISQDYKEQDINILKHGEMSAG